jgi:hypothetical protein
VGRALSGSVTGTPKLKKLKLKDLDTQQVLQKPDPDNIVEDESQQKMEGGAEVREHIEREDLDDLTSTDQEDLAGRCTGNKLAIFDFVHILFFLSSRAHEC